MGGSIHLGYISRLAVSLFQSPETSPEEEPSVLLDAPKQRHGLIKALILLYSANERCILLNHFDQTREKSKTGCLFAELVVQLDQRGSLGFAV